MHTPKVLVWLQKFCQVHAGGHERYRTLRNIFYTDLSGVIIVHDGVAGRCTPVACWKALSCYEAMCVLLQVACKVLQGSAMARNTSAAA